MKRYAITVVEEICKREPKPKTILLLKRFLSGDGELDQNGIRESTNIRNKMIRKYMGSRKQWKENTSCEIVKTIKLQKTIVEN